MKPNFYESTDDIPEAQRDGIAKTKERLGLRGWRRWLVWFLVGLLSAIAGLAVSWLTYQQEGEVVLPVPFKPMLVSSSELEATALADSDNVSQRRSMLNHFAYEEAEATELVSLTNNPAILMQPKAADSFEKMRAAAQAEGVTLMPISGFRTEEDQEYLFFEIKAERAQTPETRAQVSAPPGYSEHHTGYAIDIGDATDPDSDLSVAFEATAAFQWLETNAARYSFELSFPEGNAQGVQYEPWHWRYVGDPDSLETFYQDR